VQKSRILTRPLADHCARSHIDRMADDDRRGFHAEEIAAVATGMAQMIEAHGGPDSEFARRMAAKIQSGAHGATDDERRFLELAAHLASLFKESGLLP
jgi:hypothetical protein